MPNPYPPPPAWAAAVRTIAVTGTDGKSSTTRYCAAGLAAAGSVARMTTVDAGIDDELGPPPRDHAAYLELMGRFHARGGRLAAIEATSAALGLGFARAWPVEVAVFTNLGHDHMRTHGTPEHYLASKAQLFVGLPAGGAAILNAEDPHAELIAEVVPVGVRVLWFAGPERADRPTNRPVDLRVRSATPSWAGLALQLEASPRLGSLPQTLTLPTPAQFQALNAAAALLACVALGVDGSAAAARIAQCPAPSGRFEVVCEASEISPGVIVDYAHTPEALHAALASAAALGPRRLIVVLGAGGDGDRAKRPELGAAAGVANELWLTSDNPRDEDPSVIAQDLAQGVPAGCHWRIELDRDLAIHAAIAAADPGDIVVIAGKGHERTQTVAGVESPFSDRHSAERALACKSAR